MMELPKLDAQILRFVLRNGPATKEEMKKAFPEISAVELRVDNMAKPEVRCENKRIWTVPNTSYLLEHNGIYRLTELGKKALQDYDADHADRKRELWLKNAWIPILVAFITTVVTNYILPKLPSLLQWLASMFAKTPS